MIKGGGWGATTKCQPATNVTIAQLVTITLLWIVTRQTYILYLPGFGGIRHQPPQYDNPLLTYIERADLFVQEDSHNTNDRKVDLLGKMVLVINLPRPIGP